MKFQLNGLEEQCERAHMLMERDTKPYMDNATISRSTKASLFGDDHLNRSPFYRFKSEVMNQLDILK